MRLAVAPALGGPYLGDGLLGLPLLLGVQALLPQLLPAPPRHLASAGVAFQQLPLLLLVLAILDAAVPLLHDLPDLALLLIGGLAALVGTQDLVPRVEGVLHQTVEMLLVLGLLALEHALAGGGEVAVQLAAVLVLRAVQLLGGQKASL